MTVVGLIARDELRLMRRNRVALLAFGLLVLLTIVAMASSWSHRRQANDLRMRHQHAADAAFDAQPDRHPHRVVHYGSFVFRPLGPLAAFDPGVDAYTGNSIFLEGHRQNTANFGDVRQSSSLIRFGQMTPAFVLQVVAPLLLIFLGFGAVSRETERGTLRVLMLQGVRRAQLMAGKLTALLLVALAAALPALLGLAVLAAQPGTPALPALVIAIGYVAYLALWTVLILLVSALVHRSRDALLALIALWAITTILLPRIAPDLARHRVPLMDRLNMDVAIARNLRTLADSHNPDDPHFTEFKRSVFARYGVTSAEDLPINLKGLLALEGERMTSALFDRFARARYATHSKQAAIVDTIGWFSPAIAIRSSSMAAAGTDFAGYRRFFDQAEAHRYRLVQRLNRIQAQNVSYADDTATDAGADRRKRVGAANWQAIPDFTFVVPDELTLARAAVPGLATVLFWLAAGLASLGLATRRLGANR